VTAAKNKSFDKPKARGPSIKIGPTWSLLEELDFTRLTKLHYDIPEPKDLYVQGT
jgi:translation initiation factor 3 subunit D